MTYRLKSMHKKNSELQKFKMNVKNILFLKEINAIGKLKLSDKDKELIRQTTELEK